MCFEIFMYMGKNKNKRSRLVGDQTSETSNSDLSASNISGSKATTALGTEDTLCLTNVCQKLTYNGIHNICKEFG